MKPFLEDLDLKKRSNWLAYTVLRTRLLTPHVLSQ